MRIALLSSDWRPTGGVATYVRALAAALVQDGHQVSVVHGDGSMDDRPPEGIELVGVPGSLTARAASHAGLTDRVVRVMDTLQPDLVHVQSNNNFVLEDALRRRRPIVKTFHVHEYCPAGTKYHFALDRPCRVRTGLMCVPRMGYLRCTLSRRPNVIWSLYRHTAAANAHHRQLSHVIVCSEHLKRQAVLTGFDSSRVEVVPYFTAAPDVPRLSSGRKEVLFVGRLVRAKGADLLLEALARTEGDWTASIVGQGPELAKLERQADALNLGDRVSFPGWLTGAALSDAYDRAAVVVVPSRWPEPFGIVGLEAMAHCRPVLAFDVGGIPEWLAEGIGGLLLPPNDIAILAERLAWMLSHSAEASVMADRGRARVAREFSSAAHLAKLLPIYERACRAA